MYNSVKTWKDLHLVLTKIVTQARNLHAQHVHLRDAQLRLVVPQGSHHSCRHVRHSQANNDNSEWQWSDIMPTCDWLIDWLFEIDCYFVSGQSKKRSYMLPVLKACMSCSSKHKITRAKLLQAMQPLILGRIYDFDTDWLKSDMCMHRVIEYFVWIDTGSQLSRVWRHDAIPEFNLYICFLRCRRRSFLVWTWGWGCLLTGTVNHAHQAALPIMMGLFLRHFDFHLLTWLDLTWLTWRIDLNWLVTDWLNCTQKCLWLFRWTCGPTAIMISFFFFVEKTRLTVPFWRYVNGSWTNNGFKCFYYDYCNVHESLTIIL